MRERGDEGEREGGWGVEAVKQKGGFVYYLLHLLFFCRSNCGV